MALEELFKTFEFLKKRIEEHREYLSQDETRTRQVLIDPLLKELGWDVGDPAAVELEYRIEKPFGGRGNDKPDYALMMGRKADDEPVAVVEAKTLASQKLDDATEQVHTYAIAQAIPYGVVTDGDEWRLIDVRKPVKPIDKVTTMFQVSVDDASKCALRSLALWRSNICAHDGPVDAVEPVLIGQGIEPPPPPPPPPDDCEPLPKLQPKGQKPVKVRLDDGEEIEVSNWTDVVTEVAKALVRDRKLRKQMCPVMLNERSVVCFVNDRPQRPDGTEFKGPVNIGQGMWLETFGAAETNVKRCEVILEVCGVNPSEVCVELAKT